MDIDLRQLLERLNPLCYQALERSSLSASESQCFDVSIEHFLLELNAVTDSDFSLVLKYYGIDHSRFLQSLHHSLGKMKKGNDSRPSFSSLLIRLFSQAWLVASVDYNDAQIRSFHFIPALLRESIYSLEGYTEVLSAVSLEQLKVEHQQITSVSQESPQGAAGGGGSASIAQGEFLPRFTTDYTEQARQGDIDPVLCREPEIRQMVDILIRRRKNNPILVGDAGVGKTALVEGLANRIIADDVPSMLKDAKLIGLDLGSLQAGASISGEFEKRLKGVISELKALPGVVILFIDEVHTLIGAGNKSGGGDAANLLKPALARGELRAIGATTWAEYKKYFEKDPALARRFQLIKIEEPSIAAATTILRGIRHLYEKSHGVYVRDEALEAAAEYSAKFISGRQLPDKAVDVLDTACGRVSVSISTHPACIEDLKTQIKVKKVELESKLRDVAFSKEAQASIEKPALVELDELNDELSDLETKWEEEMVIVKEIIELRKSKSESSNSTGELEHQKKMEELQAQLKERQGCQPLVNYEVTTEVVGEVISGWTGIPMGKMQKDESKILMNLENLMSERVKGQGDCLKILAEGIRSGKSGLRSPNVPLGIFFLVGPSGVGKSETAYGLADIMFGGPQSLVRINMAEFSEKHTVSRLIGSPPGYVGYGEGGVLTEAVRQHPYSVVLLDEFEKASEDVKNLFHNVFDKGVLNDGEGREIDFKNTVILLTGNLAAEEIRQAYAAEPDASLSSVRKFITPTLTQNVPTSLIGRVEILPYRPLTSEIALEIVHHKLKGMGMTLKENRNLEFSYSENIATAVLERSHHDLFGARDVESTIHRLLSPHLSKVLLENDHLERLHITINEENELIVST
jgi:type VI secretion system protein VasG